MNTITSHDEGLTFSTNGICQFAKYEFSATVNDISLSDECRKFLEFIVNYVIDGNEIQPDETIAYGYWITKAVLSEDGKLVFWEYDREAVEFIFGISNALHYWQAQQEICSRASAEFVPIRPDQKIAISDGVYDGSPVSAVRYPAPPHMSGWYLTTNKYDGNISSLKVVHAYHVSAQRPDLAKYFALPCGYRFHSDDDKVWFDEKVVQK